MLAVEVWQWDGRSDLFTLCTRVDETGGTRIAGPKMTPGCARLLHTFWLNARDVRSILEAFKEGNTEERYAVKVSTNMLEIMAHELGAQREEDQKAGVDRVLTCEIISSDNPTILMALAVGEHAEHVRRLLMDDQSDKPT